MMMCSDGRRGRAGGDGSRPGEEEASAFHMGDDRTEAQLAPLDYEHLAADMHAANRRRAELFGQAIMADRVMDIMLTALIAHEQGTVLTRKAAGMANRLAAPEAGRLVRDLIEARLLRDGPAPDQIVLTATGVDRMRDYIRQSRAVLVAHLG
ncbi:MAG: hypothetical protein AB7E05_02440 [Sphingobium sp.]